jgi:hypothetical protein
MELPANYQLNSLNSSQSQSQIQSQFGLGSLLYSIGEDPTENATSNSFSVVAMGGYLEIARILLTCLLAVTKNGSNINVYVTIVA